MSLLLPVVMILSILVGIKIVCVISGFSWGYITQNGLHKLL
jgi:hypothetical protein